MFDVSEPFYVAIHATDETSVQKALLAVEASIEHLTDLRMMLMIFSKRIEHIGIFYDSNLSSLNLQPSQWKEGASLDSVIGVVLADHTMIRDKASPQIFVHTTTKLTTSWNLNLLSQITRIVWLDQSGLDVGVREAFDFKQLGLKMIERSILKNTAHNFEITRDIYDAFCRARMLLP